MWEAFLRANGRPPPRGPDFEKAAFVFMLVTLVAPLLWAWKNGADLRPFLVAGTIALVVAWLLSPAMEAFARADGDPEKRKRRFHLLCASLVVLGFAFIKSTRRAAPQHEI